MKQNIAIESWNESCENRYKGEIVFDHLPDLYIISMNQIRSGEMSVSIKKEQWHEG